MQRKLPTQQQLNVFISGISLILLFFTWKSLKSHNPNALLFVSLIFVLIILYFIKKDFVIKFYNIWMQCASIVGMLVTSILMIIIFYIVFGPVGLFLRILRKDPLNLRKNSKLKTYWIDKPQRKLDKSSYEKQF